MADLDFSDKAEPIDFSSQADIASGGDDELSWSDLFDTAGRQALQGATFGFADEITDPLGVVAAAAMRDPRALITGEITDPALQEEVVNLRGNTLANLEEDWNKAPVTSALSNIAGGITTGGAAAKGLKLAAPGVANAISNVARQAPKTTALLTGAGGTGLYSAGEAEGPASERADDFWGGAAWGGPLGLAGYSVAKGLGRTGSALVEKYGPVIANAMNRGRPPIKAATQAADNMSIPRMAGILDEADVATLDRGGRTIPLTKGDITQDVGVQRIEQMAAEAGSKPMLAARGQQQEAARRPFLNALGEGAPTDDADLRLAEQEYVKDAADIVRGRYDELGRKVKNAYDAAKVDGRGVAISGKTVSDDLVGGINDLLADEAYRVGDIPALDKNLDELREIIGAPNDKMEFSPASITALENWKKRLNATIGNTPMDQKDSMRKLKMVGRQYDAFLTSVADDAIVNGDESAIRAFKDARGLAKEKFNFYESDKAIQRILDTRELSGEKLVNIVLGAEKFTSKGDDGLLINKMFNLAGDRAPEMKEAMKKGLMARAFRRGIVKDTIDPENPTMGSVSFPKMRTEVGNLISKKEIFSTLFDEKEQQFFKQFYKDLKPLASKQKGAINNSSTGIWTAEFAKNLGNVMNNPLIRSNPITGVPGKLIDEQFQRYAAQQITGKAEKGLAEFLEQQLDTISPKAAYYGAISTSAVGPEGFWDVITQ